MTRVRRFSTQAPVKKTVINGVTVVTESGVSMQGHESAQQQTVT